MTSILDEFRICAKIPQNYRINIKSFCVFNYENIIFTTNECKVYGLGNNKYGALGLGHNTAVEECTEIEELSHHKINDFFNGFYFVLGRNEEKQLFGWGRNNCGQLGKGYISGFSKLDKIKCFKNKTIEDICCGSQHTYVLLSNGLLYGWGDNSYGQLGLHNEPIISKPMELKLNDKDDIKFKYIYCCDLSSFAITTNGLLYSWGYNRNGLLGQAVSELKCIPRVIDLLNVQKICSNGYNSYFLTNEGSIYFCGRYKEDENYLIQNTLKKVNNSTVPVIYELSKICLYFFGELFCCDTENTFYKLLDGSLEMLDENYQTFNQLNAKRLGITPQTVHLFNVGKIENFRLLSLLGSGGFGTVGKYWNNFDKGICALKKINIGGLQNIYSNDNYLKEVETMAKLKSRFVVQYNNSWIENNCLYIQMEYCFDNLRNVLNIKPRAFERKDDQVMSSAEYFISCEIFSQITEALNYLHSLKPEPLIHRDLKPENILIGMSDNKRICKLADFGLSKFIDDHSDYHTMVGATHKYRAPDIASGHKYDTKVDIWSLGIIGLEIFALDKDDDSNEDRSFSLTRIFSYSIVTKLQRCDQIISNKLLTPKRHHRISCKELLTQIKSLRIPKSKANFEDYQQKFQELNLQYFKDIASE